MATQRGWSLLNRIDDELEHFKEDYRREEQERMEREEEGLTADVKAAITTLETVMAEVDDEVHNPSGNTGREHHFQNWLADAHLAQSYRDVIEHLKEHLEVTRQERG
jgi:hypothetical protein